MVYSILSATLRPTRVGADFEMSVHVGVGGMRAPMGVCVGERGWGERGCVGVRGVVRCVGARGVRVDVRGVRDGIDMGGCMCMCILARCVASSSSLSTSRRLCRSKALLTDLDNSLMERRDDIRLNERANPSSKEVGTENFFDAMVGRGLEPVWYVSSGMPLPLLLSILPIPPPLLIPTPLSVSPLSPVPPPVSLSPLIPVFPPVATAPTALRAPSPPPSELKRLHHTLSAVPAAVPAGGAGTWRTSAGVRRAWRRRASE
mmetsp:Transcript_2255/g.4995  ORF Transcript_2255/g.4995 Transcript_2255/m.4995 type:complete len:260 (+) Transcript_2255:301-1080(+)